MYLGAQVTKMFSVRGLVTALQTLGISQVLRLVAVSFLLGMGDFWKASEDADGQSGEPACDWRVGTFSPEL